MKADPYHPDWQRYVGNEPRAVGADVVSGDAKGEVKLLPKPGSTTAPTSGVGANAQFKFDDGQIGKKLGKHVKDYGGSPGNLLTGR